MAANSAARIVESTRGGKILEIRGLRHYKHSDNRIQTQIYWRCTEHAMCNETCTTNLC